MRLLLMGTGPFAGPSFEALLASEHDVCGLVTRPSAAARGRGPAPSNPMRDLAARHGLATHAPDSINSAAAHEMLRSFAADLLVVCDYGQILSADTLGLAPRGGINLHGSLLPKYRGAAPVNWAIWQGETETGVSVIHMTPRLDGGPLLAVERTPIGPDETAEELEPRLAELGVAPVLESIRLLSQWDGRSPLGEPQDAAQATPAPRLKKQDGRIDWSHSAERIRCQFRALQPWPGVFFDAPRPKGDPQRVIVTSAAVAEPVSFPAGTVAASDAGRLWIACGDGVALSLRRVKPAGKREMDVAEYLRGNPLQPGAAL